MNPTLKFFSWQEFDWAVAEAQRPIADSLCPIPRGGLVLAVALSHRFGLPIVNNPTPKSIYVDDIADSGKTLLQLRIRVRSLPALVLIKKAHCLEKGVTGLVHDNTKDWIVFPWENQDKAVEDYEHYISQRNL